MNDKVKIAIQHINAQISEATAPNFVSKEEAVEILEEVASDVEAMIDALKDEIKRDA